MYNREIFRTVSNIRDQNGRSKSKSLDFKQIDNNANSLLQDSKYQLNQLRSNINNLEYKNIYNTIDNNSNNNLNSNSKNYFFNYNKPNSYIENDNFKPRLEKSIKKDDRITYYNEKKIHERSSSYGSQMSNFSYNSNSYDNPINRQDNTKINSINYDIYRTHNNFERNNNFSYSNLNEFDRKYRNKNNHMRDKYSTFYDYESLSKDKIKNYDTSNKYQPNKTLDNNFISNTILEKNNANLRNLSRNKDDKFELSKKENKSSKSRSVSYDLRKNEDKNNRKNLNYNYESKTNKIEDNNDMSDYEFIKEIKRVMGSNNNRENLSLLSKVLTKNKIKEEFLRKTSELCKKQKKIKEDVNLIQIWRWIKGLVYENIDYKDLKVMIKSYTGYKTEYKSKEIISSCINKTFSDKKTLDKVKRMLSAEPKSKSKTKSKTKNKYRIK